MKTVLTYTGRGDAFIHVPARDLTDEDFAQHTDQWMENNYTEAFLIASGFYEKPKADKKDKSEKDGKA